MTWGSLLAGLLARPWARRVAGFSLVALTIALFILNLRRTAERAGRAAAMRFTWQRPVGNPHRVGTQKPSAEAT